MFGFGKKKKAYNQDGSLNDQGKQAIDTFIADKVKNLNVVCINCETQSLFTQTNLVKLQRTYHLNNTNEVKALVAGAFLKLHGHYSKGVPEGQSQEALFNQGLKGREVVFQEMTDLRSFMDAFGLEQVRAQEILSIIKNEAKATAIVSTFNA